MALGNDCVSLDNNYVHKIAQYGQYCDGDGNAHTLTELGIVENAVSNPLYCALVLSLGYIAKKVQELHLSEKVEEQTV